MNCRIHLIPPTFRCAAPWNREVPSRQDRHFGFTLVELLIVILILMIMAGLASAVYTSTMASDRVRSAARQIQSALLGAQSRAIQAKSPRGIRFVQDPTNATIVTSMVYIGTPSNLTGRCQVGWIDADADGNPDDNGNMLSDEPIRAVRGLGTDWVRLAAVGALINGTRIRIDDVWYTVSTLSLLGRDPANPSLAPAPGVSGVDDDSDGNTDFTTGTYPLPDGSNVDWDEMAFGVGSANNFNTDVLHLTRDFAVQAPLYPIYRAVAFTGVPANAAFPPMKFELELAPAVLPNEKPLTFPTGVVIDLAANRSVIPAAWSSTPAAMDIMFTPKGTVSGGPLTSAGPVIAQGLIHLWVGVMENDALTLDPNTGRGGYRYYDFDNYPSLYATQTADEVEKRIGEKLLVTISAQTGNVATYAVNPVSGAKYKNAVIGSVAGK